MSFPISQDFAVSLIVFIYKYQYRVLILSIFSLKLSLLPCRL